MLSKQYIAGFLDGEGYFGIMRRKCKDKNGEIIRHVIAIKVAQRHKDRFVLEEIQRQYGGRIEERKFAKEKNQANASTLCFVNHVEVGNILKDISKYMVVKKEQSDVLKKFLKLGKLKVGKNSKKENKGKTKLFNERENLYKEIIKLNQVGRTCRD